MNSPARIASQAARILTATTVRAVMSGKPPKYVDSTLRQVAAETPIIEFGITRAEALDKIGNYVQENYRIEYTYKSLIARKLFLARHSLQSAVLLNEFTISNSCIDSLVANGRLTGYEIKTELDSSSKLLKQLEDYSKAIRYVWVVASHSQKDHYLKMVNGTSAGLLTLTDSATFSVIKRADDNCNNLDTAIMMKALRKPEYTKIVENHFDIRLPDVRPVDHFRTYLELSREIPPIAYSEYFREMLRARRHRYPDEFRAMPCRSLTHIYLQLNPSKTEYQRARDWLNGSIS